MTGRSHTETFHLLRNNAVKQRSFLKYDATQDEYGDSEEVRLVRRGMENSVYEDFPTGEPEWLSLFQNVKYETEKLCEKIEQLHEDQQLFIRSKKSAIFDQDESSLQQLEQEIESKSQDITQLFNRLHSMIMDLKEQAAASRNRNNKLLKNVLQWQFREVATLSERLRSYQREHLSRLNEKEKYDEQFVINFDDDFHDSDQQQIRFPENDSFSHSDSSIGFQNLNYQTQDQLQLEDVDNDFIRERDAQMTQVMKSIVELNQIFQEMNSMIVNQGTLMDRIDYNMETVQMKVHEGAIQLARAERSAARTRKLKCIFILCGSVFLALLIMILQS